MLFPTKAGYSPIEIHSTLGSHLSQCVLGNHLMVTSEIINFTPELIQFSSAKYYLLIHPNHNLPERHGVTADICFLFLSIIWEQALPLLIISRYLPDHDIVLQLHLPRRQSVHRRLRNVYRFYLASNSGRCGYIIAVPVIQPYALR